MKKIKIPVSELDGGIELCKKQSKMLLDSSKLLLKKSNYVASISLSILTNEELTKIRIFRILKRKKQEIDNKIWKILNDHKVKLGFPYYLAYHRLRNLSYENIMKIDKMYKDEGIDTGVRYSDLIKPISIKRLQFLESLDLLKQDCQFLNWINDDWFSVLKNYDSKTQKAIANTLYYESYDDYLSIILSLNYKPEHGLKVPKTSIGRKFIEVSKYQQTKECKKMQSLTYKTILRDYHPRYLELMKNISKKKKEKVIL